MEILVCIKQVPDDSVEISLDEATGKPALDGVTPVSKCICTYAEEMAVRLKEAVAESEVTVVSIGDDSVKNSLKNCLAVGADHAYLVKCDEAENLDGAAVAKVLAKAKADIEAAEGKTFDLIFFGKESRLCGKPGRVCCCSGAECSGSCQCGSSGDRRWHRKDQTGDRDRIQ